MKAFSEFLSELTKPKGLDLLRSKLNKKVDSVDTRNTSWMVSIVDFMKNYNFLRVGSGKYASVFINKKYEYAVKIFMKDAAYIRWISFVIRNPNNKYVPKVRGKVLKLTPLIYAIRLEKLSPYKGNQSTRDFMGHYAKWKKDPSHKTGDQDLDDVFSHFLENKKLLDLHGENMMMRGNQVVVIDPYYNWFGKEEPGKYMINPNNVDMSVF